MSYQDLKAFRFTLGRFKIAIAYIGHEVPAALSWVPQTGRIFQFDRVIGRHVCVAGWSISYVNLRIAVVKNAEGEARR